MPADRSRRTDGLRDAYVGVVAQQGRVTLDRDFNAEHGYLAGRLEAETIDVIGPCGTPDDGFKITLPAAGSPPLWVPPKPLMLANPEPEFDFLISPGVMYLGGQRAVLPGQQGGAAVSYSFFDQPDLAHAPAGANAVGPDNPPKQELVYLALNEREVSAVEDSDLLEVALGGPDTTQRLRLMRRVSRLAVTATDCTSGWDDAQQAWVSQDGLTLDPATMALKPDARLQVSFADEGATTDPCDPVTVNGYLGAENQTIRVQIADNGGSGGSAQASLIWGYDNASFLYRATPLASNPAMLTIAPSPPDTAHFPQTNQVVEILRTAAVIASEPDMTDPTGQATIVRCVAEARGFVARLTQPYGPTGSGDPTSYLVLDQPLPAAFLADTTPLFVRVWQSQIAFDPAGDTVLLTDDVSGASTGVQVTISTPQGEPLTPGAYWEIAVRPSTPQAVYPERLLTEPQPPDGPALWACPLAVIDWTQTPPTVTDCRSTFTGLVGQGGGSGCCTVSITPTSKVSIQQAIDIAGKAGAGTVCLGRGIYEQTAPIVFGKAHAGVTLEACQSAFIGAKPGSEAAFSEGLIQILGAPNVTLQGLSLAPPLAPRPTAVTTQMNGLLAGAPALNANALAATGASIEVIVAIRVAESTNVTVDDCVIGFIGRGDPPLAIFGAGVMAQGDCQGLTVEGCTVELFIAPTFTVFAPAANTTRTGIAAPVIPVQFQSAAFAQAASAAEAAPAVTGKAAKPSATSKASLAATTVLTSPSATVVAGNISQPVKIDPTAPGVLAPAAPPSPPPPPPAAASPPPPAAPLLFADPIVDLAHAAFQAIAFNTISTNATVAQNHLVALVGVLAAPTIQTDSQSTMPCNLGQALVRKNRFSKLTLGFFGLAGAQTLRLEDNDATGCLGGLWLGLTGWRQPSDPKAQPLFQEWTAATSFTELLVISAIGFSFPPPAGSAATAYPGPSTVFVTGNGVEPPPAPGGSTSALAILANLPAVQGADPGVSIVVANNRLRSRGTITTPTAFISTGVLDRAAVTGNLMLSEPAANPTVGTINLPPPSSGPSLWLVPDPISFAPVAMITATGNVLQGRTTLNEISRAGDPADFWANLNALSA